MSICGPISLAPSYLSSPSTALREKMSMTLVAFGVGVDLAHERHREVVGRPLVHHHGDGELLLGDDLLVLEPDAGTRGEVFEGGDLGRCLQRAHVAQVAELAAPTSLKLILPLPT
jgi:hypothetical protein